MSACVRVSVAVSASASRVSDLFWGSLVLAHVYDFNLTKIYVELCVRVCVYDTFN